MFNNPVQQKPSFRLGKRKLIEIEGNDEDSINVNSSEDEEGGRAINYHDDSVEDDANEDDFLS